METVQIWENTYALYDLVFDRLTAVFAGNLFFQLFECGGVAYPQKGIPGAGQKPLSCLRPDLDPLGIGSLFQLSGVAG